MVTIVRKSVLLIFTLFLVFINTLASGGDCGCKAKPPASPQLAFADHRLAIVYPIIQKFKNTITCDPLGVTKSWVGTDICKYKGFFCESPPDNKSAMALASVDFNGFRLTAPTLHGFLDQLPDIAIFHANSNNLSGTISPEIAKLPYLYELDLSNNQFSGQFPTAILGMKSLTFLDLRFNFFTGPVPPQLFTKDLDALFLNNNGFTQRLPDAFSTHFHYLSLANNKIFGPIPRSIWKALSGAGEVLLLNNTLSGCVPYDVGFLNDVLILDASYNRLTGPLPSTLGWLDKVEVLNFTGNLLFGNVPEAICGLGNLVGLSLADNYFTRVGPVCLRLIASGVVDVRNNCIPGLPFQRSVADCVDFFSLPRTCS